jgi:pimeloyl-ACP methyl ester carboxylesterase
MTVLFEHRITLAGCETRALELEGEGPTLLLLHGFADSADTWRILLDRLRRRGRRAVALDLPGYATAAPLEPGAILPQHDRFVDAALERFGAGGAVIVGNSLGGCLALRAAERRTEPIGVVPIAPAGLSLARWIAVIEGEMLIRLVLSSPIPLPARAIREAVAQVYRTMVFAHPRRVDPRVVAAFTHHFSRREDIGRYLASGRRLRRELDDPFHLDRVRCPVLLVWGDRDRLVFTSGAERVLREVPNSRLEVIEDCGHCPQIEEPGRLTELIEQFCAAPEKVASLV